LSSARLCFQLFDEREEAVSGMMPPHTGTRARGERAAVDEIDVVAAQALHRTTSLRAPPGSGAVEFSLGARTVSLAPDVVPIFLQQVRALRATAAVPQKAWRAMSCSSAD